MTYRSAIHRYLDPGETLGELLGGFIMLLNAWSMTIPHAYAMYP